MFLAPFPDVDINIDLHLLGVIWSLFESRLHHISAFVYQRLPFLVKIAYFNFCKAKKRGDVSAIGHRLEVNWSSFQRNVVNECGVLLTRTANMIQYIYHLYITISCKLRFLIHFNMFLKMVNKKKTFFILY